MNLRTASTLTALSIAGAVALAVAAPLSASAHVGVEPSNTAAGSYSLLTFAVPHGCDASSTTKVTIDIPQDVLSVTPTVNPNWTVEKISSDGHVDQVVYTALTPLPDGYRDTLVLEMPLPNGEAGDVLEFPTLQTCEVGETAWNESTEDGEEPEHPSPAITLTAAAEGGDAHAGHGAAEDAGAAEAEDAAAEPVAAVAPIDEFARILGIGGLVVGVLGVVVATTAIRRQNA